MNLFLVAGAVSSGIAALLHVGCIMFGAAWYHIFGAGERMASLAESGSLRPALITAAIVIVLSIWSLYALSGAGLIGKLPLLRFALSAITAIYLIRGFAGLFLISSAAFGNSQRFWLWSSMVCLIIGLVHLIGLIQIWPENL